MRKDQDFSYLITEAAARQPIEVGEQLVGVYLRNMEEVNDVRRTIEKLTSRDAASVGLIGSRLEGRFTYNPRQLFARLYYTYGQEFDMTEGARAMMGFKGEPSEAVMAKVERLADYLAQAAAGQPDYRKINFDSLDDDLKPLMQVAPMAVPFGMRPVDLMTSMEIPAPLLFPDIDLVVFKGNPQGMTRVTVDGDKVLGKKSGTVLNINTLSLGVGYSSESVVEGLLANYKPLAI